MWQKIKDKIKYVWLKAKRWLMGGSIVIAAIGAGAVTETNILSQDYLNYPLLVDTSIEKLEYASRAGELLRLQHNIMGAKYRDGIITKSDWENFLTNYFEPRAKYIWGEMAIWNDKLGYNILPADPIEGNLKMQENMARKDLFKNSTKWTINLETILNPQMVSAATENITTYTEVDPNNRIATTTSKSAFASLARNEDAYVYSDKGVNHFNGDFEYLFEVQNDGGSENGDVWIWSLTNLVDDYAGIISANGDALSVDIYFNSSNYMINLREVDGGTLYSETAYNITASTLRYCTVKRDEAVGANGTLYLYTYSDSARTNLLNTQSIALHTSKKDFRYIYATQTYNDAAALTLSGFMQNLDLQEAGVAPVVVPPMIIIFE